MAVAMAIGDAATMGRNRLGWLVVALTAACVFAAGILAPKHNWDIVAYVAASYAADGASGRTLRDATYGDIRRQVDAASYRALTEGPYPAAVARDPVALQQQLPFYTPRIAYLFAVHGLGHVGGSYTWAAHLITAAFGFLSVLVMGAILMRAGVTTLVLPLLVSPIGLLHLARIATPDTMACFASLLLVATLVRPGWGSYALVAVLPAIRSDYLIFSALVAIFLFAVDRRARAAVALATATALYLALGWLSGNYGYLNLLNFTLFGQQPYPAHLPISSDPGAYAAAIAENTNYMISDGVFLLYVMALALLWQARARLGEREISLLVALPVAFATIHFALFPSYDKRFLVSSFFLMAVGVLRALSHPRRPADG